MVNIFANISASSKCKLLKILEANTYNLKKNDNIFPILKGEKTIGIVLSGLLQIVRIDYNGNKTLIEELEEKLEQAQQLKAEAIRELSKMEEMEK